MIPTTAFLLLLAGIHSANAFYAFLPPGHKGARHRMHISDQISRAFSFNGPQNDIKDEDGLTKFKVQKRSVGGAKNMFARRGITKLEKRLNDFKVDTAAAPSASNSAGIDQDGTDFSYFAQVKLGSSPGETFYLLLDTGSSATWVMGSDCTSDACKTHSTFGSSDSSSEASTSGDFSIGYNTGSVSGKIVTDTVSIAGLSLNMGFGVADTTTQDFNNYPMDGIMGLARTSANTDFDAPAFLEAIMKADTLKSNVFGINLDRAGDGTQDGEVTFGGVDNSKISGNINYLDTTDDKSTWTIPADDVEVNGKSVGLSGKKAVIDTGTTYMFLPPDDAKAVFAKIDGSEASGDMWHVPCDTTTSIALVFNKVSYSISPQDYVGPKTDDGLCYSHIIGNAAVNGDDNTWLIGDTFLKNVYSVFDADKNRVGLANKAGSSSSSSTGSGSSASSSSSSSSSSSGSSSPASSEAPDSGIVGPFGGSSSSHGSGSGSKGGSGSNGSSSSSSSDSDSDSSSGSSDSKGDPASTGSGAAPSSDGEITAQMWEEMKLHGGAASSTRVSYVGMAAVALSALFLF